MKLVPPALSKFLILTILTCSSQVYAENTRSLEVELSGRHFSVPASELVAVFGDEDKIVADLIEFRETDSPPYLSTRSVKLLLSFSSREDVKEILRNDVVDSGSLGLCSVILANLNEIPDQSFRVELAKLALDSISSSNGSKVLPSRLNRIKSILNSSSDNKVRALLSKP